MEASIASLLTAVAGPAAWAALTLLILRWLMVTWYPAQQAEHKAMIEQLLTTNCNERDRDRTMYADTITRLCLSIDHNTTILDEHIKALVKGVRD